MTAINSKEALNVFVGGPLHGQRVPLNALFAGVPFIEAQFFSPSGPARLLYVRVLWWVGRHPQADTLTKPATATPIEATAVAINNDLFKTVYVPWGISAEDALDAVQALDVRAGAR